MTTLRPKTSNQCAAIDEFARQQKAGELSADYWEWRCRDNYGIITPVRLLNLCVHSDSEYYAVPRPAHPHYATYLEWQRLVNSGEVGRGWWAIFQTGGATLNPEWRANFYYQIRKTDKHPDNAKPALKLIDWSKVPVGATTNQGGLVGRLPGNVLLCFLKTKVLAFEPEDYYLLLLAEQTTFTHLPDGTPPPVVEGLVFEYEYPAAVFVGTTIKEHVRGHTESRNVPGINAYRVIGLAPGYTDNPELAS